MSWNFIFLFSLVIGIGWALLKYRGQQPNGSEQETGDTGAPSRAANTDRSAIFQSQINEAIAELREQYRLVGMFPFWRNKARNTFADLLTDQLKTWCQSRGLSEAGVDWRMTQLDFERLLRQIVEARQVPSVDDALDVRHVNELHDKWLRIARERNFNLGSRPMSLFELNLAWALKFGTPVLKYRWEHAEPFTGTSSPPAEAAPVPAKSVPPSVLESVSVVLRRQVPVRWEEPARSWVGGLPRMPESVAWPLGRTTDYPERGLTPLHFVAQIACADLPPELWGGLGPRAGWLLLFLDGQNCGDVMENPEAIRVLHIAELGPERTPPPGVYPVRDEVYTGPNYGFVRTRQDIPTAWRRWPVDLVTIPNRAIEGAPTPRIIPENFASILYDGAPVKEEGRVEPPWTAPFTWRGALYVVDSIARVLAKEHKLRVLDREWEKLSTPGWIADAISRTDAEIAKLLGSWSLNPTPENASAAEKIRPGVLDRIEKLRAARQLLAECADAATLQARIGQTHRDYAAWREAAKPRVAALRERIIAHDLDTPIAAQDWEALRAALDGDRQPYWWPRDDGRGLELVPIDQSLLDYARDGLHAAQVQLAADYYVSGNLRHLVPAELVAFMEPHWRSLYANRPHRMGGLHDGIQSEAREGPTNQVLLFQIASDDAMHWCWGDVGAYYVFIDTDRLAAGDFSKLDSTFENH
jgi:hypothetical protein